MKALLRCLLFALYVALFQMEAVSQEAGKGTGVKIFAGPDNFVKISWTTQSEENSSFFTIERSQDSSGCEIAGKIMAAGNAVKPNEYTYIDTEPVTGFSWYRIRQTSNDGCVMYPDLEVSVTPIKREPVFQLGNTFSTSYVTINLTGFDGRILYIEISDIIGKNVYSNVIPLKANGQETEMYLPVEKWKPGVYIITGANKHQKHTQKIVLN